MVDKPRRNRNRIDIEVKMLQTIRNNPNTKTHRITYYSEYPYHLGKAMIDKFIENGLVMLMGNKGLVITVKGANAINLYEGLIGLLGE